jgi:hypothetical protein
LSRADEKAARIEALLRLEPRRAVVIDRVHHDLRVIDTLALPVHEAEQRASSMSSELKAFLRRGKIGTDRASVLAELEKKRARTAAVGAADGPAPAPAPKSTAPKKPKRGSKVVLP